MSVKSLKMPHISGKASYHFKKDPYFFENAFKKKKHRILKKKSLAAIASLPVRP
jgi:hypothetical protein